ncbi:MAG: TVP38/TMEM64 family protein [Candidatus Melainabacteria bacterium]|nr:TVP38/TMEM64 family protein [Candidatus Melainabacteria bacterium]
MVQERVTVKVWSREIAGVTLKSASLGLMLWALYAVSRYMQEVIDLDSLSGFVKTRGPVAPLIYCGIYLIGPTVFLPASVLTMAGGVLFGPVWGTVYTIFSATAGATVPFLITRRFGRKPLERMVSKFENFDSMFQKFEESVEAEGWKYVAFTRLVTLFPFLILNYAFGLTRIQLWTYVWASFVFMLPGSFMFTYMGYAGREALSGAEDAVTKISIAVGCFIFLSSMPGLVKCLREGKESSGQDNACK